MIFIFYCTNSVYVAYARGGGGSVRYRTYSVLEINKSSVVGTLPLPEIVHIPQTIRKDFPETWLWDTFLEMCVSITFSNQRNFLHCYDIRWEDE